LRRLPDAVIVIIDFLPLLNFLTDPLIEIRRAYRRRARSSELGTSCRLSVVAMTTTTRTDSLWTAHEHDD